MNSKLFLILGDQLFESNATIEGVDFVMIESNQICSRFNYHKQKLAFVLGSMREHRDFLRSRGRVVHYFDLEGNKGFGEVFESLASRYNSIEHYDISDKGFSSVISSLIQVNFETFKSLENLQFLTSKQEFQDYLSAKTSKRLLMNDFYIWQRKRLNILLDEAKNPVGGEWNYDDQNRKKLPKSITIPDLKYPKPTQNTLDVQKLILEHFPNNPGKLDDLWLANNYEQARGVLKDFLDNRLVDFGAYEDALSDRGSFLFHSVLSPYINNGLLTPDYILQELFAKCQAQDNFLEQNLNSVEGFVRQLIGWREWVKGLYDNKYDQDLTKYNFFECKNELSSDFYFETQSTSILESYQIFPETSKNKPLELALSSVERYGYNHHIERLMVISNWMLLNEIDPMQCYKWFMEMYVDAYDWVMVPNVFGMGLFADGGIFATKPYVSGGNYLKKMADYKIDLATEKLWTDKFWNFLLKHKAFFKTNPRMAMLITAKENKEKALE